MNPYDILETKTKEAQTLDESAHALQVLLSGGFSVTPDGQLYSIKELVGSVHGLRVHVYADEHPPPHFHVLAGDLDVSFSIIDGTVTKGQIDGKRRRLVEWWYARSRALLIARWNETRPSDCPVGPVAE